MKITWYKENVLTKTGVIDAHELTILLTVKIWAPIYFAAITKICYVIFKVEQQQQHQQL